VKKRGQRSGRCEVGVTPIRDAQRKCCQSLGGVKLANFGPKVFSHAKSSAKSAAEEKCWVLRRKDMAIYKKVSSRLTGGGLWILPRKPSTLGHTDSSISV